MDDARALRPGGPVAIWKPVRQERGGRIRQFGGLLDLFFGFFSEAGTWSAAEVAAWFAEVAQVDRISLVSGFFSSALTDELP